MNFTAISHCLLLAIAPFLISPSTLAQTLPNPVEESLPQAPDSLLESIPAEQPLEVPIELEAVPKPNPSQPTPSPSPEPSDPPTEFFVETILVLDNSLFAEEIQALVAPLEGRQLALADLIDLRTQITQLYVEAGYISSGAFVPTNQELTDGEVQIQVVEGEIEKVQTSGLSRLKERYVRSRLHRFIRPPLNIRQLEDGLRLLQTDPALQQINAELVAGSGPGQNILTLSLVEADALTATLSGDNYRAPSIGSLQGTAAMGHRNLLGFGDRLNLSYSLTEGLDNYQVQYALPVNGLEGTFSVRYRKADSNIVQDPFQAAGIRSESETLSLGFRQPLWRSVSSEFALGLDFDWRESRSFILDDLPFSFSVGPEDGVSRVSVLRFSQDWVNRDINTVLAARSQFSVGIDAFDATVNSSGTDGLFFAWLGQFQWVEQFSSGAVLVTQLNTQLTPDSLLPLERFSLGGIETVRGYAQNQLVTDNAIALSTEFRYPLARRLQLVPFIEGGGGWNNRTTTPAPSFLLGTGLGMRWQPIDRLALRADYGIPLTATGAEGNSLQENGLYFSIDLFPL